MKVSLLIVRVSLYIQAQLGRNGTITFGCSDSGSSWTTSCVGNSSHSCHNISVPGFVGGDTTRTSMPGGVACTAGPNLGKQRLHPALQTTNNSQGWSLCKFLRSDRHYYKSQFADSLNIAVTCGDLDVVVWLFQHFQGCSASTDLVEMAAFAGHLHILKYLWENGRCAQVNSDIPYEGDPRNVVFWGGNDMRMAAKRGHGDIARWLYEYVRGVERDLNRVMVYTVRKGDVELVQWLLSNVYCDVPHLPLPTINDATRTGHLHMVQWLFDHGFVEHVGDAFRNASMSNYFSIVKWFVEHGILENVDEGVQGASACGFFSIVIWLLERNLGRGAFRSMFLASMNGYVEVAQYVHAKGITDYGDNTMYMAAERGHLNVVMWLHLMFSNSADVDLFPICRPDADGYPRYSTAMDAAASNGHLDVLQFLHSVGMSTESPERRKRKRSRDRGTLRRSRAPTCTRAAMTNAAAEGHLEVDMWLHANRTEGCSPNVMNAAARNGHLEVVQWLHENILVGCTTASMDGAAANGHLDVVKWLHDHRSDGCTTMAMDRAANNGDLHVVQWLHINRTEGCTPFAMDSAARSGHLQIVKWLHRHRSEGCTDNAMDGAAYNGHFDIVQWLHRHRSEGCTIDAMHFAAVHGHFEVVLFLHSQRSEGCSRYTAIDAAARGNSYIVGWLGQHYPASSV